MQKQQSLIVIILILIVAAIVTLVKFPLSLGLDLRGGSQLTIQVQPTAEVTTITLENLEDTKRVMENRVNGLGVSEPIVQTIGSDKILVQLPGVSDPEQAERVLGGTAQLEFRNQIRGTEEQFQTQAIIQRQILLEQERLRAEEPENIEAIAENAEQLQQVNQAILAFFEPVGLTGKNLINAQPQPLQGGVGWEVAIEFDNDGGENFAQLTKDLAGTGRSIGIFLDNTLVSSPTVGPQFADAGITGGRAVVTGNFTAESASDLAVQIRCAALPFPVKVVENRTVGATLGRDSINRSVFAGISGLILVLIFMAVYYRLPGMIADVSLAIYTLLTLACYALIGVTLTLPGIAGFILSIGMAVDANVLIFERTREELRSGKTLYRSVESGFYRAFSSILDSNVTTLIACAALGYLGSGLVRGFAVTLAIGVIVSMFTAVSCSRSLLLITVLGLPGVRQKPELFCPNLNR